MKKLSLVLGLLVISLGLTSCFMEPGSTPGSATYKNLNTEQFLAEFKKQKGILIDVRTSGEYNNGFIPGAINIDYYDDLFEQKLAKLDSNKSIFVYCKVGGRSSSAAKKLTKLGFKKVYNLKGGYKAYKKNH